MLHVTRLLFIADDVRESPCFETRAVDGSEPTITTKVTPNQRKRLIRKLRIEAKRLSACGEKVRHSCIHAKTLHHSDSVSVAIIFGRDCLQTTDHVNAFLEAANTIASKARIESIRETSIC